MATRTISILTDDFDGHESESIATVRFALDGTEYEIDLDEANQANLRDTLAPYIEKARPVHTATRNGRGTHRTVIASNAGTIRKWAASNGIDIADRGRIPNDVRAQFSEAQQ